MNSVNLINITKHYNNTPTFRKDNASTQSYNLSSSPNIESNGLNALSNYNKILLQAQSLSSEFIYDPELSPLPQYIIPNNLKDLNGVKDFYPDGKIKTLSTYENGIVTQYFFNSDENLFKIIQGNKIVEINELGWQHIIEQYPDGTIKETYHENRDDTIETHIGLTKGNTRKCVSYSDNIIKACKKTINNKGFYTEFNKNGTIKKQENLS